MDNSSNAVKMFDEKLILQSFNDLDITKAHELFCEFKSKNIIMQGEFVNKYWLLSDEYSNIGIRFNINEVQYRRYYEELFELNINDFTIYIKCYILFTLGELSLISIRQTFNDIKNIISLNPDEIDVLSLPFNVRHPNRVIDFFTLLPDISNTNKMEVFLDTLEKLVDISNSDSNTRELALFDSYFLFMDILNDYWFSNLPTYERLFYYPLYLWWEITGIIPLRPREFIVTPRKCLEQRKDGWYLTLRRNQIKGTDKSKTYKIDGDYIQVQYKITDELANQILNYIELTKDYESTELDTLFITDPHYIRWKQKKHINSRYFTYVNMNCVLRYFFHEIIQNRYGLKIIYEREINHLEEGCINYIYLGDTRHISLINIIAEGGTPVIAMSLAGHDTIDMASHYYQNISSLIECRTYRQYRKVLQGNVTYEISTSSKNTSDKDEYEVLDDGARCYSPLYAINNFTDCTNVIGPDGEIGYCPKCTYYRRNNTIDFYNCDDFYKRQIEDECKHLERVLCQVRLSKGDSEDILQAMMRLQNCTYSYQQYYNEKIRLQKEKLDGQK